MKENKEFQRTCFSTFEFNRKIDCKKFSVTKGRNLPGEFDKFAAQKEWKFTQQRVRLRLHLLELQPDPWKMFFTVTCTIMDTSAFANCLNSSQPWYPKIIVLIDLIPKKVKNTDFLCILYSKPLREFRKPKSKNSHLELWLTLAEGFPATFYARSLWPCCSFFQKTSNIHNEGWTGWEYTRSFLSERVDQSHLAMDLFTKGWVPIASTINTAFSKESTELFYKLFAGATESGWSMGSCNEVHISPIRVSKW